MKAYRVHHLDQPTRVQATSDLLMPEREAMAFLVPLSNDYPGIDRWFMSKVVPGYRAGSRIILRVEREGALVGLGIAKNEPDEKKICTVRVAPEFAGRGVGVRIFDGLLKWLDCDRPHLTVSDSKLPLFERIFDYYGFFVSSSENGRYVPHACELGYNELGLGALVDWRAAIAPSNLATSGILTISSGTARSRA